MEKNSTVVGGIGDAVLSALKKNDKYGIAEAGHTIYANYQIKITRSRFSDLLASFLREQIETYKLAELIGQNDKLFRALFSRKSVQITVGACFEHCFTHQKPLIDKEKRLCREIFSKELIECKRIMALEEIINQDWQVVERTITDAFCTDLGEKMRKSRSVTEYAPEVNKNQFYKKSKTGSLSNILGAVYASIVDPEFETRVKRTKTAYAHSFPDYIDGAFSSIVMNLTERSSDLRDRLYQDTTLRMFHNVSKSENLKQTMSVSPSKILEFSPHSIVIGDAGSGKSTLICNLLQQLHRNSRAEDGFFILIDAVEFIGLDGNRIHLDEIILTHLKLFEAPSELSIKDVRRMLRIENFTIVIDGLDEVEPSDQIRSISRNIELFLFEYEYVRTILVCRTTDFLEISLPKSIVYSVNTWTISQKASFVAELFKTISSRSDDLSVRKFLEEFEKETKPFEELKNIPLFLASMCVGFVDNYQMGRDKYDLLDTCVKIIFSLHQRTSLSIRNSRRAVQLDFDLDFKHLKSVTDRLAIAYMFSVDDEERRKPLSDLEQLEDGNIYPIVDRKEFLGETQIISIIKEHFGEFDAASRQRALYILECLQRHAPILKRTILSEDTSSNFGATAGQKFSFRHSLLRDFMAIDALKEYRRASEYVLNDLKIYCADNGINEDVDFILSMMQYKYPSLIKEFYDEVFSDAGNNFTATHQQAHGICLSLRKPGLGKEVFLSLFDQMAYYSTTCLHEYISIRTKEQKKDFGIGASAVYLHKIQAVFRSFSQVEERYIKAGLRRFFSGLIKIAQDNPGDGFYNKIVFEFLKKLSEVFDPENREFCATWSVWLQSQHIRNIGKGYSS